ncbi:hypothetical protein DZK25_05850 [Wenzhouxiangella sp. 15181]|nr:hypothetical protein DZK25_05850 [Wenzhouxiangella sp. 15181]RFP70358.1 hypothetical protein DZK26_00350 [Wenzhouxiangella sp. 15190]
MGFLALLDWLVLMMRYGLRPSRILRRLSLESIVVPETPQALSGISHFYGGSEPNRAAIRRARSRLKAGTTYVLAVFQVPAQEPART